MRTGAPSGNAPPPPFPPPGIHSTFPQTDCPLAGHPPPASPPCCPQHTGLLRCLAAAPIVLTENVFETGQSRHTLQRPKWSGGCARGCETYRGPTHCHFHGPIPWVGLVEWCSERTSPPQETSAVCTSEGRGRSEVCDGGHSPRPPSKWNTLVLRGACFFFVVSLAAVLDVSNLMPIKSTRSAPRECGGACQATA